MSVQTKLSMRCFAVIDLKIPISPQNTAVTAAFQRSSKGGFNDGAYIFGKDGCNTGMETWNVM